MMVDLRKLPQARMDFVKPMLAKPVNQLPSGRHWLYELKLDGYRVLVMKQRDVVTLFSRRGNNLNNEFPRIAASFSFLPNDTILDGELVVLDDNGRPSFAALQKHKFTQDALHFYVFDLIVYKGKDLRKLSLIDRRTVLEESALTRMRDPVRLSAVFSTRPSQHFARLRTSQCPFANLPEPASARRGEAITAEVMKKILWLKPKLVAHIEFTEWTKGNHLRHSKFIALRYDKKASAVFKES